MLSCYMYAESLTVTGEVNRVSRVKQLHFTFRILTQPAEQLGPCLVSGNVFRQIIILNVLICRYLFNEAHVVRRVVFRDSNNPPHCRLTSLLLYDCAVRTSCRLHRLMVCYVVVYCSYLVF
jgi:hypothetical protein